MGMKQQCLYAIPQARLWQLLARDILVSAEGHVKCARCLMRARRCLGLFTTFEGSLSDEWFRDIGARHVSKFVQHQKVLPASLQHPGADD